MIGYLGVVASLAVVILAVWRGWEAEREPTHHDVISLLKTWQTGWILCAVFVQGAVTNIVSDPDIGDHVLLLGANAFFYGGFALVGWKASEMARTFPSMRQHADVLGWWTAGLLAFTIIGVITVLWQNRVFSEYPEMRDGWSLPFIYGGLYAAVTLPLVYMHLRQTRR